MKTSASVSTIARLLSVAFLVTIPPVTAGVLVSDSFETPVPDGFVSGHNKHAPNTTLAPPTDNTGLTENYWVFGARTYYDYRRGSIFSWATGDSAQAAIAIGTPAQGILEVEAVYEFNTGVGQPVQWGSVALLARPMPDWLGKDGGNLLWAIVRPDGRWTVFQNGTGKTLKDSTKITQLPAFARDSLTTVTLRHNMTTATVALFVDGANISGRLPVAIDATQIAAAGFKTWPNSKSDPRSIIINRFSVSTHVP
jgi:hypothetical protein